MTDYFSKKIPLIGVISLIAIPHYAQAAELNLYGSLRTQVEMVSPDTATDEDYSGFRDAYSRVGASLTHTLENDVKLDAKVEIPIDSANGKQQDPWDHDSNLSDTAKVRVASVKLSSPKYGTVWAGQDWLPYYNDIAYPVDYFSSYYSGFATFTTFRRDQTIAYSSPDMNGVKVNVAHSRGNGNKQANGDSDDRNQATISYKRGDSKVALGVDDIGGADNRKVVGVSLAQTLGDFYVGAKYEQHKSDVTDESVYGHDGSTVANLYGQYNQGKHTVKGHVAKVDNYGEDVFHLGYDYQLNKKTKLFAEYYSEEEGGAITKERGGYNETYWNDGGTAFAVGVRYDFDTKFPK